MGLGEIRLGEMGLGEMGLGEMGGHRNRVRSSPTVLPCTATNV